MIKQFFLIMFALNLQPALASEKLDSALLALAAIEADPAKLQSYCAIKQGVAAIAVGYSFDKIETKLEEDFRTVQMEYDAILETSEELADDFDEAQIFDAALDQLWANCITDMATLGPLMRPTNNLSSVRNENHRNRVSILAPRGPN